MGADSGPRVRSLALQRAIRLLRSEARVSRPCTRQQFAGSVGGRRSLWVIEQSNVLYTEIDADAEISCVTDPVRSITRGGSFAFGVPDHVWSLRYGTPYREVLDMGIPEISVGVAFPAYAETHLTLRQNL